MAKNDQMLAILWMLNSGAKITAKQIAQKLEISIRTVYRYIDSLCASGVPVVSEGGQNGGYRLLTNFIQAPLVFDTEEQKSLLHAAIFAKEAGYTVQRISGQRDEKAKTVFHTGTGRHPQPPSRRVRRDQPRYRPCCSKNAGRVGTVCGKRNLRGNGVPYRPRRAVKT
jgi:biotin operon repressor